jgi:hypothetical protein
MLRRAQHERTIPHDAELSSVDQYVVARRFRSEAVEG